MKRDQADATDVEPHVFDQTNGALDDGADGSVTSDSDHVETDRPDNRTTAGIAMWAANHF